jgi:pimeloyl-ACP methyl ester carboxylesterase
MSARQHRLAARAALPALFFVVTSCARSGGSEFNTALPAPPVDGMIEGPAGRLHVDDGGTGGERPVVLVHAFAGNSSHWAEQLAHLRQTRRTVAIDLRGHGQSEPPRNGDYTVASMAEDLAVAVDRLNLSRFVLVGHSMGGAVAAAYAGGHPERVSGLVLVGTPGKSSPEKANQILTSMKSNYEQVTEEYWKSLLSGAQPTVEARIRGDLQRLPRDASLAIIEAIFAYDPLPALGDYDGPKLIVDTSHGDGPDALHNQVPRVPRTVITGTSHWPQMDKPQEFNRILDEFLANFR